jgi:hypothetical protein
MNLHDGRKGKISAYTHRVFLLLSFIFFLVKGGGSQSLRTQHLAQGHIPNLPQTILNAKFVEEIPELVLCKSYCQKILPNFNSKSFLFFIFFYLTFLSLYPPNN